MLNTNGLNTNFCEFVYELLLRRKVSREQSKLIANNAWRKATVKDKESLVQRWLQFSKTKEVQKYDLSFDNIVGFLEYLRTTAKSYSMVKRGKNFIAVFRKLLGVPIQPGNMYLIDKYLSASFNVQPPQVLRPTSTWDVNILLDYFIKLGPNESITKRNVLGGKLVLQLLLTQMCQSGEVTQLQLSTLRVLQGAVQFKLTKPTKTFTARNQNVKSSIQLMKIKEFEGNPLLCPVKTLMAYIEQTRFKRQNVDHLFVSVTTQEPRQVSHATIVRWAKDIMRDACLHSFNIHSTRGASSLLMGLPLDNIVKRVGWTRASTFVKYYMKPVKNPTKIKEKLFDPTNVDEESLPDPHGFVKHVNTLTPKNIPCKDLVDTSKLVEFKQPLAPVYAPIVKTRKITKPVQLTDSKPCSDSEDSGNEIDRLIIDLDPNLNGPKDVCNKETPSQDLYDFVVELVRQQEKEMSLERQNALAEGPHVLASPYLPHDVSFDSINQMELSELPVILDTVFNTDLLHELPSSTPLQIESPKHKYNIALQSKYPSPQELLQLNDLSIHLQNCLCQKDSFTRKILIKM